MSKFKQMNVFMHVVQLGSITKAASKLDVSKSVISQHLKQLEHELGVTLLNRTTRRQNLTPAGQQFFLQCCEIHKLSEQAWQDIQQQQSIPQGKLRITAPHALMEHIVIPALSDAFRDYNLIELDLICHDGHLDLMQEDIDLAIRVGQSKSSNLKQKRLGDFNDVLCSSSHLQSSWPKSASDIERIPYIAKLPYVANHWQHRDITHSFFDATTDDLTVLKFEPRHKANTLPSCINLLEQGMGVGIVPDFILQKHPLLNPVFSQFNLDKVAVYALHPYQTTLPISVNIAINAISHYL